MKKNNCWEYKDCGRQPGGKNVDKYGACPAAVELKADGINSGMNGGRSCWAIAGTLSNKTPEAGCSCSDKKPPCFRCSFYTKVLSEEGVNFVSSSEIHEILNEQAEVDTNKGNKTP